MELQTLPDDDDNVADFRAIFDHKEKDAKTGSFGAFVVQEGVVQLTPLPALKSRGLITGIADTRRALTVTDHAILPVEPQVKTYAAVSGTPVITTGPKWFDMKTPHMTPELKTDLTLIANRKYLDPKRFYKKDKGKKLPKHFQIGTVISAPHEFFSSRLTNKERAQSQFEEVHKDSKTKAYLKRKFTQIQAVKSMKGHHKGGLKRKRRGKK